MDAVEIHRRSIGIAEALSPMLADAIARVGPMALDADQSEPLADRLCRSVAGQQLSVKAARSIWQRVLAAAGKRSLADFFMDHNVEALRQCGLSAAKVRTMCGIAEAARAGRLDVGELATRDHAWRSARLTALWGVGQWTADMISMFYFGEADVWPEGDVSARKTLERLTSRRRKTVRTAARFTPYRSYLALYMWAYLDTLPAP